MTVQPGVILDRLRHLSSALAQLEELQRTPATARTWLHQRAAERALQVACEALFDLGHHVLSGRGAGIPTEYRGVVPALEKLGILNGALAQRLSGLAGFRNILVHDYVELDEQRVWELIETRLPDLRAVMAAFAELPELKRE